LVNYGDSDSEKEELEVILIDKDGDKFKRKRKKTRKTRSVDFFPSAWKYKELRNTGVDIDEAAMRALKELNPETRRVIPPMTNTIKEAEQASFWMQGSAAKKMDTSA